MSLGKSSSSNPKKNSYDFSEDEEDSQYYTHLLNTSSLPVDHKPAKGRGRSLQLSKMTKKQREEEKLIRLEKNRLAAKDCRLKKKRQLTKMERKIEYLENIISSKKGAKDLIKELKKKEQRIEILEEVANNQSATIQKLLENTSPV